MLLRASAVWPGNRRLALRVLLLTCVFNLTQQIYRGYAQAATAAFVTLDRTTQGTWKGVYGSDGYNVIGDSVHYPTYAQVSLSGKSDWTWAASATDLRALQKASASDRVAACWYSATSFTVDVNLTDGQTHRVALYCLDWDTTARAQTVDVLDATTGVVLSSQPVSSFNGGAYLVWDLKGHVQVRFTNTGGVNAVLSGLFFATTASASPNSASASFVTLDRTTQGTWKGVYGSDGYNVVGDSFSYPSYAQLTPGTQQYV